VQKYLNAKKIPQLFVFAASERFADPKTSPYTISGMTLFSTEAAIYARLVAEHTPGARVAVLYQNDDYGKDLLKGLKDGLGAQAAKLIVAEATYEVSDPTVDSQIVQLQASGADVLINITTPKFAAQAIRKVADIGWKPVHYLNQVSSSVGSVLKPAGLDKSVGLVSMQYIKDPTDPKWGSDKAMQEYFAFMKKYLPGDDPMDGSATYGMAVAQLVVQMLKQCGDNLTRENVMKQAASLKYQIPMALPGVIAETNANDFAPFQTMQLAKFDGKTWQGFGEPMAVR
jgi:ABC-type branched-subunit amino acid transport system substrate-binding protein